MNNKEVLDRFFNELIDKGIVHEVPRNNHFKSKYLGITANSMATYRHRNHVPFQRIVESAVKYDLDLNVIFKD